MDQCYFFDDVLSPPPARPLPHSISLATSCDVYTGFITLLRVQRAGDEGGSAVKELMLYVGNERSASVEDGEQRLDTRKQRGPRRTGVFRYCVDTRPAGPMLRQ